MSVTDGTAGSVTASGTVTTKSMISAQAGGVLVSGLLGAGAIVGQTIHLDVTYDFGGADVGTTYDLQAVGNSNFAASCFQMVGSTVTSSNILAIPANTPNKQYFTATAKQTGNGQQATIRYYFKYLCAGMTSTARPYSNQLSGTQLKYSSNYETFVGPTLPGATNPFTVAKSAARTVVSGGDTVTFTVTINNPSSFQAEIDSIADALPGTVMAFKGIVTGSGVTALNSGSVPADSSTGALKFRGPWAIPANGALTLRYRVRLPAAGGQYTNTATAFAGTENLGSASATVTVASYAVTVVRQGPSPAMRFRGIGSDTFTVTNTSNVAESFGLLARVAPVAPAAVFLTIDSIAGPGITRVRADSARISLAAAASGSFVVWFRADSGAVADNTLYLRARSVAQATAEAEGSVVIRRVFPVVTLAKSVLPAASSPPGTDLTYTLQLGNAGEGRASTVAVTDNLPAQVLFKIGSVQQTLPAGVTATVEYSADNGANWTYVPGTTPCTPPQGATVPAGYDICVNRIRWTLSGSLPADAAQSAGTFKFVARIR
jgi:uncharacterized repeat protein (TIGR01451 family)